VLRRICVPAADRWFYQIVVRVTSVREDDSSESCARSSLDVVEVGEFSPFEFDYVCDLLAHKELLTGYARQVRRRVSRARELTDSSCPCSTLSCCRATERCDGQPSPSRPTMAHRQSSTASPPRPPPPPTPRVRRLALTAWRPTRTFPATRPRVQRRFRKTWFAEIRSGARTRESKAPTTCYRRGGTQAPRWKISCFALLSLGASR
jgi:hypothetical protein